MANIFEGVLIDRVQELRGEDKELGIHEARKIAKREILLRAIRIELPESQLGRILEAIVEELF